MIWRRKRNPPARAVADGPLLDGEEENATARNLAGAHLNGNPCEPVDERIPYLPTSRQRRDAAVAVLAARLFREAQS